MKEKPLEYYFIFESWSLDSHQWSMIVDGSALILTVLGFVIAFLLYDKQRKDKAKDAFEFFQASLPELKHSLGNTIDDLEEFIRSLDLDNTVNPVLSASLNDKFLNKINIVNLNRFYKKNRRDKLEAFKEFLVDSNFFGDYQSYFSNEIHYFRNAYQKRQEVFSEWQQLRSKKFFIESSDKDENMDFKKIYDNWVIELNKDKAVFDFNAQGMPVKIKDRKELVENKIDSLAQDIIPFIESSEKANEVSMIANRVIAAYDEISEMRLKIRRVIGDDIAKFENVLKNMNDLLE
ncbi:hypothetical protein [Christiangramia forsetii]|uniref:Uncharacterized protein n=2 Tax=Christiangramia forsetii TaxID=411153 RepID=A0LXZ5_CHRFK|nr:hypothetical protein [Christiangramia forsetii]CAL65240.1 hypothetical protein GFO_0252 [Christiangramia forsetii KT0803]